jgi:uncharacterized protein YndB with AHSA1/START domain
MAPDDQVSLSDDGPLVRAAVLLPGGTAGHALAAFTEPAQLAQWWGGTLDLDLVPGGPYVIRFPQVPATMTGQVRAWVPGELLEFAWAWDYDPGAPPRTVTVRAREEPAAVLAIAHGPHDDSEEGRRARAEHRAGWEHFLPRLAAFLGDQPR